MIIREYCAENLTQLSQLDPQSISRVELCDNLAVGGTTPSYGVIKEANRYLQEKGISTAIMIRPRGGNFVYNDLELRIMEEDILKAVELESDSLVFGTLTAENTIDEEAIEYLLPSTQGLPLVFHMAFDQIAKEEQKAAIDTLVAFGFSRILTHGGAPETEIMDNLNHLKELIDYAGNRIDIVLGGGITNDNYQVICQATNAKFIHGTQLR